jgi:hypothetical protein
VFVAITTKEDHFELLFIFIHFDVKVSQDWSELSARRARVHAEVEKHKFW